MYSIKTTKIDNGEGYFRYLNVEIFDADDKKVAEYLRKYGTFYSTFLPFVQNNHNYALISADYTQTWVLDLESGEIVAKEDEEKQQWGFCPVEFWHPNFNEQNPDEDYDGTWALVSGCVWGDDSSWKVQYLDLSKISEGLVLRDDRFGYIELAARMRDSVEWYKSDYGDGMDQLTFPVAARVARSGGKPTVYSTVTVV